MLHSLQAHRWDCEGWWREGSSVQVRVRMVPQRRLKIRLRIKGYLLLPEAFRSLSRLSSALSAKASTLRSFLLGHSDLIALTSDGWCCLVCFYFFAVFLQRLVSSLSYVLRILDVSYMQFSRYIKMRAYLKILNLLSHIWLFYQPFKHKSFLCLNHW